LPGNLRQEVGLPSIRVLVADDHKDWRQRICSLLAQRPELQVVCQVADGPQVVQKAEELRPDLILLDIGLPTLNGIEAARQVRRLSPDSQIIFLSQENSVDVVQAALSTGALCYVYKADAGSDLLLAVDSVLCVRRFLSRSVKNYNDDEASHHHRHELLLYSDDWFLVEGFSRFIARALKDHNPAILVATPPHREGVSQRLESAGIDVVSAIQQGAYIPLDVEKMLASFMLEGSPDPAQLAEVAGGLITSAAKAAKKEHPRVAACGECAPRLWAEGNAGAALRLEQLLNCLAGTYAVDILCGYPGNSFDIDRQAFGNICAEHSAVLLDRLA